MSRRASAPAKQGDEPWHALSRRRRRGRHPSAGSGPAAGGTSRTTANADLRPLPPRLPSAAGRSGILFRSREPRRPDRLHHLRPQHRLLHRPDREEAAQPVLSRHGRALVRHGRLQPRLHVLPELGHVAVAERRGRLRTRPSRRPSPPPPGSTAAAAWPSPTTIRSSGPNTPSTPPKPAARRASRPWPSPPATSRPPPAATSTRTWTPPTSISRGSPSSSTATIAAATCSRCSTRCDGWPTRVRRGWRSRI